MNGTSIDRIPKFLEGEPLPVGYYDSPNPYADPPVSKYNLRSIVNYALMNGKKVAEITKDEAAQFLVNTTSGSNED